VGLKGSLLEYLIDPDRSLARDPMNRLAGFVFGFSFAQEDHCGVKDPLANEFFHWFYHERGERSSEGFWTRLSRECEGDQVAAARKLRELAIDFLRRKGELA